MGTFENAGRSMFPCHSSFQGVVSRKSHEASCRGASTVKSFKHLKSFEEEAEKDNDSWSMDALMTNHHILEYPFSRSAKAILNFLKTSDCK